jgi:dipeptidyl aminopeptidase/acylaminoacyl peptidase
MRPSLLLPQNVKYKIVVAVATLFLIISCSKQNKTPTGYFFQQTLTPNEIKNGKLNPEILWKFGRVIESQLSPDGKQVAFIVKRYNLKENKGNAEIFKILTDGKEQVQLTYTNESESNVRWAPDGIKLGYLSDASGSSQIWEMNIDGSNQCQISHTDGDIEIFDYSPDGKNIFFTQRVKTDTSVHDIYPDLPKANAMVITDLMYRHWDSWTDYKHSHIFIASLKDRQIVETKDIMNGESFDSPLAPYYEPTEISWSPDGKNLAYTCKKLSGKAYALSTNSDIYLYIVETGKTKNLSKDMLGYDRNPVFSHDSRKIAWESMPTPGYESDKNRLMVMDLATGFINDITSGFDQSASNICWDINGNSIYFISGINATFQVFKAEISGKKIKQLTKGWHDYTSLMRKNSVMVGEKMSFSMSMEIFKIDESGAEYQITFTNKNIYDSIKLGSVKERWVKTTDGKQMLVWLIFPPGFDSTKIYPAILYCEGGPQIAVSQFFSYRWNLQLMAANGYVIIAPNRRGLPTFGQEWNDEIAGDYGGQNMKDYLSAVDEIKKEPFIDPKRIGAVGASYGAYSVFYLAGCHQNRFKAFIAHCGMFNLESQYAETEETFFPNHDLGGPFWQANHPKSYGFSPHRFVQNWNTPIMVITGANDFRIPYTESLQAFNAAQLRGIPSKLLFFPDESHWVLKPQNSVLWQNEFFKWLDKWLK